MAACSGRAALAVAFALMLALVIAVLMHSSHLMDARHDGLSTWLVHHPPRKVGQDNELLRRQRLASLVELSPAEMAQHASAIIASLDHSDSHVRKLAVSMLERLEPTALVAHALTLTERLGNGDAKVRLSVTSLLPKLGEPTLVASATGLVGRLTDEDAAVRSAAVESLARLPSASLATYVRGACDRLQQQGDAALSDAAITSWSETLAEQPEAMSVLGGLKFSLGRMGREFEHENG